MRNYLLLFSCVFGYAVSVNAVDPLWIGKFNWAVVAPLNSNINFSCVLKDNTTTLLPANHSVVTGSERWKLAGDDRLLGPHEPVGNKMIDGEQLRITNIQLADKGIFLCHVELDCMNLIADQNQSCQEEMWFKHGLNLNGPLYPNILDKYTSHFMVAGISSGSLLVTLVLLCLIYKFRFKDPNMYDDSVEEQEIPGVSVTSYSGPDGIDTKM